jgi:cobalt-zinc-cadmium efflux system outer membrane protein
MLAAVGRRQLSEGRGRADGALPNPTAEWRRENYYSDILPDIFATLQVPIDLSGRRLALRQAGKVASQRGRSDSAATHRQLDVDVLRSYWQAALAIELSAIATTEREARERTAAFDAQRFREGAVAEVVAMRTRLEADRARVSEASAQAEAARARAHLARVLGVSMTALPALAPLAPATLDAEPDTTWAGVRSRRPDLSTLQLAVSESERRWRAESRGIVSDVNVVGGYKGTAGVATGVLGILVPFPIFNRNEGPRERAKGEHTLARADLLDAEARARADVVAAMQAWSASRDAGEAGAATMDDRAIEVAAIAEAAYREGALSLVELIEAQRARADARATAARWMADSQLTLLELRRATGAPLLNQP